MQNGNEFSQKRPAREKANQSGRTRRLTLPIISMVGAVAQSAGRQDSRYIVKLCFVGWIGSTDREIHVTECTPYSLTWIQTKLG